MAPTTLPTLCAQAVLAAARQLEATASHLGFTSRVVEGQALSRALSHLIRKASQAQQQRHLQAARQALAAYASGEAVPAGQPLALDAEMYK
jgi:hypothetical protein